MKHAPRMRGQSRGRYRAPWALGAALVAACTTGVDAPAQTPAEEIKAYHPTIPAHAVAVAAEPVEQVTSAVSQIMEPTRTLIRDQATWASYWNQFYGNIAPLPPVPTMNFSGHVIAVAAMGSRNSGGYAIEIEGSFEADGVLWVAVVETSPGPLCMSTAALTAPAVASRIASSASEVRFTERSVETDCS